MKTFFIFYSGRTTAFWGKSTEEFSSGRACRILEERPRTGQKRCQWVPFPPKGSAVQGLNRYTHKGM